MKVHGQRFAYLKRLLILLLLEDIVDWVLFNLSTTCLIKTSLGETLSSKARTLFFSIFSLLWCEILSSGTTGSRIKTNWLVSRPNICSQRSFIPWLVATNRRSNTLLYNHRIHSLKIFYRGPAESIKTFGWWLQKSFLPSNTSNFFVTIAKPFPSVLSKKVHQVPLRMGSKSEREPAKHEKTSRDKLS